MNGKFWLRRLVLGRLYFSIVYNGTFDMTDGPIRVYRTTDDDGVITLYSLRFGHLWLNLDIVR